MRKRRLFLAAGACLATVALTMGTVMADPVPPPPPPYPPVVIVGAQTTQDLFNTLCNNNTNFRNPIGSTNPNDRQCQSYDIAPQPSNITTRDPATHPGCTIRRPRDGVTGTDALVANPTCVDVARVTAPLPTLPLGFSPLHFVLDGVTYAIRSDSTVPRDLTAADLTRIYQCDPSITFPSNPNGFKPLLPFGSSTRTFFLQKLGFPPKVLGPCVRDTDSNGLGLFASDGRVLTDPAQLVPYSIPTYLTQVNNVIPDIHGTALLGSINSISPAVLNPGSVMGNLTYAIRGDSTVPRDLTAAALTRIYQCDLSGFKPLLPAFGSMTRKSFLTNLGLTDSPTFAGSPGHSCVQDTDLGHNPLPPDDGRVLTDPAQLVPYSIPQYLTQVTTGTDIHGTAVLGSINSISPEMLNTASFMSRDVYNVVRTTDVPGPGNIHDLFVGPGSKGCSDNADITRYGFAISPICGM